MAFNFQTFKTRALSAVVFVAIMLIGLLYNHWSFFILFSIIHFGCWIEYQKLMGLIDAEYKQITNVHKYGVMIAGWAFMLFMAGPVYSLGKDRLHEIGKMFLLISGIILPLSIIILNKKFSFNSLVFSLIGLLYISVSWGLLIGIRSRGLEGNGFLDDGWRIPVILIASIWVNDTMAYMVGSFIGKTPFSKISPKKTWEGTAGGAILCVAFITLVGRMVFPEIELSVFMAISTIAAVIGTLGDLLESKIKRMAKVKDSGQIMPGHGGFLDRFDSLLLATPIVWLYLFVFNL